MKFQFDLTSVNPELIIRINKVGSILTVEVESNELIEASKSRKIEIANTDLYAIIDEEDFELVSLYRWHLDGRGCAQTTISLHNRYGDKRHARMHKMIMGYPEKEVRHKNGNILDNRKSNLYIV